MEVDMRLWFIISRHSAISVLMRLRTAAPRVIGFATLLALTLWFTGTVENAIPGPDPLLVTGFIGGFLCIAVVWWFTLLVVPPQWDRFLRNALLFIACASVGLGVLLGQDSKEWVMSVFLTTGIAAMALAFRSAE